MVVSFGTSFAESRTADIGGIEEALAAAFPAYDSYRAFTSAFIRARLAREGITVASPQEVLAQLAAAGYEEVLVQPTHLLEGEEYQGKILALAAAFQPRFAKLVLGRPLLAAEEDYGLLAAALTAQLPPLGLEEGWLYMGHGTPRAANRAYGYSYRQLQAAFAALHPQVLLATVEEGDSPNLEEALREIQARGYKRVHLAPLMVVAGEHAAHDMAGSQPNSWKSRIEALGAAVCCHSQGLGRLRAVQALYIQHLLAALAGS